MTRNDVAIGGNERREWEYMSTIRYWFSLLCEGKFNSAGFAEISKRFWPYDDFYHPPFSRYINGISYLVFRNFMTPFESYRLGPGVLFAITTSTLYLFISKHYGPWAGVFSAFSLLFMPRLFTHAHFIGTDFPIAAMWTLTAFSYYYATTICRQVIFSIIFGLALLTKIQAFFIPIPLILWSYYLHKTGKESRSPVSWSLFFCVSIITPLVVLLGWPWLWYDGTERFLSYLHWTKAVPKDGATYFGTTYGGNFGKTPWHYPFVYLSITVPLTTLFMCLIGVALLYKDRQRNEAGVFLLLNMIFPLLISSTFGAWEGTREFLAACVFLGGMAAVGFNNFLVFVYKRVQLLDIRLKEGCLKLTLLALTLIPSFISSLQVFPYGLFYYNKLIGGLSGASKAGFSSYWDNQLGKDLINFINTRLEKNSTLTYCQGTNISMKWYQEMGRIRGDIILNPKGEFSKVIEDFLAFKNSYCITGIGHSYTQFTINNISPAFTVSYDGVNLVGVLKRETVYNSMFASNPSVQNKLNCAVGDGVKLLGYDINSRTVHPGDIVRITYYWSKTHDNCEELVCYFMLNGTSIELNHTPSLSGFLPIKHWPPTKVFREKFEFRIPENLPKGNYKILLKCNLRFPGYNNNQKVVDLGEIVIG